MKSRKLILTFLLSTTLIFSYGCKRNSDTINNQANNTSSQVETLSNPDENEDFSNSTELEDNTSNAETSQEAKGENTPKRETAQYTIKDIYPFTANTLYDYEGKGNEYASYTVWVDYIKDNKIQLRTNNGGTVVASVIEYKDGELKLIYSQEEAYFREDFTSKKPNKNEILLKEPIVKGTSWTLPDGRKRYISNVDADVSTPLGNFKAVEVTTEGGDYKDIAYYAPSKGLVKSMHTSKDMNVTSSLKKLQSKASLSQTVRLYYPSISDDKLYYIDKKLAFKTNDITKLTFEKIFKEAASEKLGKPLSENVKIKSLYLNNNVVYVDFTENFITEMNAGSGYERLILQSIVNTLGGYYGVDRVYITVENNPYTSGHIKMNKGETFKVDTKNSVKLK